MSEIIDLNLVDLVQKIKKKELSSKEITKAFVDRSEKSKKLNVYITDNFNEAIKSAENFDSKPNFEKKLPGIPIAVKDLFCTKNLRTTAGSKILNNFVPPYESTVTQNLWDNGAILLGKLNCDEFAMGSSNETSFFGNVQSPIGENLVPGGSSGGSASALAAKLTPVTIGTDTGGSIRQPASFTGTVGLKPTYGSCSRYGIVAFASSLDQAGPMTSNVEDCALLLEVMSSYDLKDSTSVEFKRNNYLQNLNENIKGKKIGIPKEYITDKMPKEIEDLWQNGISYLKESGAEIIDLSLPNTSYALPAYYIVAPAEASSNLARYDGVKYGFRSNGENLIDMYEKTRSEGFGNEVKRRIMIGTYVLSSGYYDAYYLKAQKVRRLIKNDFDEAYKKVDAILTPSTPSSAFKINEKTNDPVSMYLNDIFTVPINLAGLPAISIPAGLDKKGYPLGLQIIGKAFDEQNILNIAYSMQKKIKFKNVINDWWLK
jgi:aspartyl-tRNA(Asn)/glutamyl-tRNA(Gln) amidotransferase subunit A